MNEKVSAYKDEKEEENLCVETPKVFGRQKSE